MKLIFRFNISVHGSQFLLYLSDRLSAWRSPFESPLLFVSVSQQYTYQLAPLPQHQMLLVPSARPLIVVDHQSTFSALSFRFFLALAISFGMWAAALLDVL